MLYKWKLSLYINNEHTIVMNLPEFIRNLNINHREKKIKN